MFLSWWLLRRFERSFCVLFSFCLSLFIMDNSSVVSMGPLMAHDFMLPSHEGPRRFEGRNLESSLVHLHLAREFVKKWE